MFDVLERHPQQVAEPVDHPVGGVDVGAHQAGDRVQRVEQEVRVQLPLQRLQLRLDQAGLEVRRVERARLRLAPVGQRVRQADQEQVGHEHPVELGEELDLRRHATSPNIGGRLSTRTPCGEHRRGVDERRR